MRQGNLIELFVKSFGHHELRWISEELRIKGLKYFEIKKKFHKMLKERIDGKPLQYVMGHVEFLDTKIITRPPVLIPRWETEEWTLELIRYYESREAPSRILDLCCGSGCIGLGLAKAFPDSFVDLFDVSHEAIDLALLNQSENNIKNCKIHLGDIFHTKLKQFKNYDLVVSNPPYISLEEYNTLTPSVKNWEDKRALVALDNGLHFYHFIAKQSFLFSKNCKLVLEIGDKQGKSVKDILESNGFSSVQVGVDMAGSSRTVSGFAGF